MFVFLHRKYSMSSTPSFVICCLVLSTLSWVGCSQNPYFASQTGAPWGVAQAPPVGQNEAKLAELSRRVQLLDDNNRQLTTQLAQSEQQTQVYRDESELLRKQLATMSARVQSTAVAKRSLENKVRGMTASAQVPSNSPRVASIRPNTNLTLAANQLNLGGIPVEKVGDVIRIILPADQLFQPGTANLLGQASATLDPVAAQLRSLFPRSRIGIEGYTDDGPLYGGAASSSHQLSAAQAAAVLERLTLRSGMQANQLFTVAQGANNPRQPNTHAAGRAANRRIELVIYPENY